MYADDIALVAQADTLETVETILNRDLINYTYISKYGT